MLKVTVNNTKESDNESFPKLMISDGGTLVLMHCKGKGTVLSAKNSSYYGVGEYCSVWNMNIFKDFKGTITLSNDDI